MEKRNINNAVKIWSILRIKTKYNSFYKKLFNKEREREGNGKNV